MKRLLLLVALTTVLFSCEKEETGSAEWSRLAGEKMEEINTLIGSVPCSDPDEWSFFTPDDPYGCAPIYFPMYPSIKSEFDRLWKEYTGLRENYNLAFIREGGVNDLCWGDIWFHHAPLWLECRDNKASLVYIKDLDAAESRTQIAEIYPRIETYLSELTCESDEGWTYTVLLEEDCSYQYIPFRRENRQPPIRDDIQLYNAHISNIINKEEPDCISATREIPVGVICEDGTPVVRTRTQ